MTTYFALTTRSRPLTPAAILMLVDERGEADDIAQALRRRGQAVDVRLADRDDNTHEVCWHHQLAG